MKYYLAPLEGITGYIYRKAYHTYFRPADKYFTPFIVPNQKGVFRSGDLNDILPEHNKGMYLVPQILTNRSEDFIRTAKQIAEYGYDEINLNLGCPSPKVVAKGRGSGFLFETDRLDRFLEEIFEGLDLKISIKTRTGKYDYEEFEELLRIYNRYPLEELIIHPRVQQDFYKNKPNWDVFEDAVAKSESPLCYNGDIYTKADYEEWKERFPEVDAVMLGRGVLRNPMLIEQLAEADESKKSATEADESKKRTTEAGGTKNGAEKERVRLFVDKLLADYTEVSGGERNVLFKMKELWFYLGEAFTDSSRYMNQIKKAQNMSAYLEAVDALFAEQELRNEEEKVI